MKAMMMSAAKRIVASSSAVLLVMALSLAGCGSGESDGAEASLTGGAPAVSPTGQIEIPVKVMTYGEGARILFDGTVSVDGGSTVLDALNATGLELDVQRSDYGTFVNGVNGITTDGLKGWIYTINGEQVQSTADKTILRSGDRLEWSYVDMGA